MPDKRLAHSVALVEEKTPAKQWRPRRFVYRSLTELGQALSCALAEGATVTVRRTDQRFELHLETEEMEGERRIGFSKRPVPLMLRSLESGASGLWAKPAGGTWTGWVEWGSCPRW
jgi:hypothetical protein